MKFFVRPYFNFITSPLPSPANWKQAIIDLATQNQVSLAIATNMATFPHNYVYSNTLQQDDKDEKMNSSS